jgi:YidC/Oxa1 family membrane protein insertase
MVALVTDSIRNTDLFIESYNDLQLKNSEKGSLSLDYGIKMRRSGEGNKESFWIYAGPSDFSIIKSYKEKFQKVLFSGWEWLLRADIWFPIICEWTLWLLIAINGIVKDYGITIILLTIIIRLITFPLTQSSMKSMSKMKDIQPKINHLRERFKTNPRKMNEEIMALYKKEGVNPFNPGCLPMFLQMPILFALFIVLRKAIELRGAGTVLIPWVHDLSLPESLISLTGIFPNGIPMYGSSIALLPIIMAVLTYFQNKMTIKDPNQKMMIYLMPPFMLVLFNNFPAGLVLYWTFSNALGIIQQYALDKSLKKNVSSTPVPVQMEKRKAGRKK